MQEEKKNNKIKQIKKAENTPLVPVQEQKKVPAVKRFFRRKHYHKQTNEQKVAQDFTKMLSKSIKVMLPWLIVPTILFLIGGYFVFDALISSYYTPLWFKIVFGIINFGFFLFLGIIYGLFMGLVASLKVFSQNFSLLIRQALNSLKGSIENKINSLSFEMFSKKELSNLVGQAFNDFNYKIRKYAQKTALGFVAIGIITSVLFFARHFIIRSFGAIKNKTEAFALISARTSLFVAIVLNLTLFTKIVLWLGVFLGIGILLLQTLFVLCLM
ncbi:MAG: hypothetical protein II972_00720 [Elusimicrobiaceae bacterium]|nr:hypothetical protein [Elusimicrobiaceae bacterium]